MIPIVAIVLFETIAGCISRWRGYVYNKARLHLCYVISRIAFAFGVIPLVTVGAGLGCEIESSKSCFRALIICNAIWLLMEVWFTYIVWKIYRKTVNGEYVIYGIPVVLGRSFDPLPFQTTDDATVVEVRGIKVEQEKRKDAIIKLTTMSTETDLPLGAIIEKYEDKEQALEGIIVSFPIKKGKKLAKGEIGIYADNKVIKPEQIDLTIQIK